jgi:type IV pilus assembly protein PilN
MIRINLLPVKKAKKRATGQRQLLLMAAFLGVELVALVGFHLNETWKLEEKTRRNSDAKAAIAKLKSEIGDYDQIKAERDELLLQRDAIQKLTAGKTGPVYVLRELAEILTKDKGPTYSKEEYTNRLRSDPNAGYNPSWDPRRLWIKIWKEKDRKVQIEGGAKSNDDVAEFLKRLQLSVFFGDVVIEGTQEQTPTADGAAQGLSYSFKINCTVRY